MGHFDLRARVISDKDVEISNGQVTPCACQ